MEASSTSPAKGPHNMFHLPSSSSRAAQCVYSFIHTPIPPLLAHSIPATHSWSVPLGHGVPHIAFATPHPSALLGPHRILAEHGHSPVPSLAPGQGMGMKCDQKWIWPIKYGRVLEHEKVVRGHTGVYVGWRLVCASALNVGQCA
jgi:hypothetical protein